MMIYCFKMYVYMFFTNGCKPLTTTVGTARTAACLGCFVLCLTVAGSRSVCKD